MNSKRYEEYQVLGEELEELDLGQDDTAAEKIIQEDSVKNEKDIINEEDIIKEDIIDVEIIDKEATKLQYTSVLEEIVDKEVFNNTSEEKQQADNQAQVVVYTPVLTEEDEIPVEESQSTTQARSRFENIYENIHKDSYKEEKSNQQGIYKANTNTEHTYQESEEQYKQPKYKEEQQETHKDTSFTSYVQADRKRERSFLAKWSIRLAKLILFIMLLPVIGIVGGGILAIAAVVACGILACIGGGLVVLGGTCFIATQVNSMIIALGISVGITAISFGFIVFILCIMFIRKMKQLSAKYKANKKVKEVR